MPTPLRHTPTRTAHAPGSSESPELRALLETGVAQLHEARERDVGDVAAALARMSLGHDQLGQAHEVLLRRLNSLAGHVQRLHGNVDAEAARTQADSATLAQATDQLARLGEQVSQRLDHLAEQAAGTAAAIEQRLSALEQRANDAVERVVERVAVDQSELRATLEARLDQMADAVEREAARADAYVSRVSRGNEELRRAEEELRRLIDDLVVRQQQLQAGVEAEKATAQALSSKLRAALEARIDAALRRR